MSDTMDSYPTPDYASDDVRDYPMPDGIANRQGTTIKKRMTPQHLPFRPCDGDMD